MTEEERKRKRASDDVFHQYIVPGVVAGGFICGLLIQAFHELFGG